MLIVGRNTPPRYLVRERMHSGREGGGGGMQGDGHNCGTLMAAGPEGSRAHFIEDDGDAALPALRHQLALEQRVHQHHPPRPLRPHHLPLLLPACSQLLARQSLIHHSVNSWLSVDFDSDMQTPGANVCEYSSCLSPLIDQSGNIAASDDYLLA